jgi:hypothetical protein
MSFYQALRRLCCCPLPDSPPPPPDPRCCNHIQNEPFYCISRDSQLELTWSISGDIDNSFSFSELAYPTLEPNRMRCNPECHDDILDAGKGPFKWIEQCTNPLILAGTHLLDRDTAYGGGRGLNCFRFKKVLGELVLPLGCIDNAEPEPREISVVAEFSEERFGGWKIFITIGPLVPDAPRVYFPCDSLYTWTVTSDSPAGWSGATYTETFRNDDGDPVPYNNFMCVDGTFFSIDAEADAEPWKIIGAVPAVNITSSATLVNNNCCRDSDDFYYGVCYPQPPDSDTVGLCTGAPCPRDCRNCDDLTHRNDGTGTPASVTITRMTGTCEPLNGTKSLQVQSPNGCHWRGGSFPADFAEVVCYGGKWIVNRQVGGGTGTADVNININNCPRLGGPGDLPGFGTCVGQTGKYTISGV